MHIVALNQVYAPDTAATAQLLSELAAGLVARGHEVTVVAAGARAGREVLDGVEVLRVPTTRLGKRTLLHRAADYGSFYAGALGVLARVSRRRPDVYLALTTPPMIAAVPQVVALGRTPTVALVQDLYPDVAVALGAVRPGGPTHRAWALATRASLSRAARVIALSEVMATHLRGYGVPADRLDVIPNWALAELESMPRETSGHAARLEYGLGDRFVVMYSGNHGAGHSFDTLLAAARRLRDRDDILFVFVGDGVRKPEVERFVQREALANVKLFPLASRERLAESLAAGDLHMVTMRDGLEGLIVPSKFYGILAASRPTLFIGPRTDSIATTLAATRAGFAFDNGDVSGVTDAITRLAASVGEDATARAMGRRGRAHLDTELTRQRALDRYERALRRATGQSFATPSAPAVAHPSGGSGREATA
jgi:glycosyltransferase involved in cell wall biosynthesis